MRRPLLLAALLLALSFGALGEEARQSERLQSASPAGSHATPIPKEILQVLRGSRTFYNVDSAAPSTLEEAAAAYGYDAPVPILRYALHDYDGDGASELILAFGLSSVSEEYLMLRAYAGRVYGYEVPYRGFVNPSSDGTFEFSNGAANSGRGTHRFDGVFRTLRVLDEVNLDHPTNPGYFLGGRKVSEAAYWAQADKPHPPLPWYRYDPEEMR